MLHDTWDYNVFSITYSIHFCFHTLKVLIHKNWMILSISVDNVHEFLDLFIGKSNLHALTSKNVGRSYKNRVSKAVCNFLGFLGSVNCCTLSTLYLCLFKDFIKDFSIFCSINILGICTVDLDTHLHKVSCKLDCCLSTKLNHSSVWLFKANDILNILSCKRLEVELIGNIKVGTYCLRVVVDYDCFVTLFFEGPCGMN